MEKIMKKTIKNAVIFILCLAVSLVAFAGCGGDNTTGGKRIKSVTFYTFGNDRDKALMRQVVDAFELENPDIKIDLEYAAGGEYYNNVTQRIGASNAPDIFHVEGGSFSFLVRNGLIENLSNYFNASENFDTDNLWELNDAFRYENGEIGKGAYYALIKDWGPTFMLVYNKSIIAQYNQDKADADKIVMPEITLNEDGSINVPTPLKWSEFLDIAHKLTEKNAAGNITRAGTTLDYVPYLHIQEWIQMTGASLFTADGSKMAINDGVKQAFQFYYDMQRGEKTSTASGSTVDLGGEKFANGALATAFYGRWAFASYDWIKEGIDVGVCAPPLPDSLFADGNPEPYATTAPVAMSIYSGSTKKAEAYKFLEFYFNEGSRIMSKSGFNIPSNKSVANNEFIDPEFITDETELLYNKIFLKFAERYAVSSIFNPRISNSSVEEAMSSYMGNWLDGKKNLDETLAAIKEIIDSKIV